ncbi:MAG: TlpA family protein disulfide reductase [Acidimicrobiia bacterium]
MTALVVALGVAVALLGVLVAGLLRSHAEILKALHDLGAGVDPDRELSVERPPAPVPGPLGAGTDVPRHVTGLTPDGGTASVALTGEGRTTLLAFLSSGCLTCRPMWEALGAPGTEIPGGARAVVVTKGPQEESPGAVAALAPDGVTTLMSSEAWASFAVPGSPYFTLVDGTGRIVGEGTAATWTRVAELLGQALQDAAHPGLAGVPSGHGRGMAARNRYIDDDLLAAGIGPGHPSLYPAPDEAEGAEGAPDAVPEAR